MRYWLLISVFVWISFGIQAQINMGVKIGTNKTSIIYQKVAGHDTRQMETKIGYMGGMIFQHFSTKNFGLQVELSYVQKGWITDYDKTFNTQYERIIDYLDMPFLSQFYFGKTNYKFLIHLGFYLGYAL